MSQNEVIHRANGVNSSNVNQVELKIEDPVSFKSKIQKQSEYSNSDVSKIIEYLNAKKFITYMFSLITIGIICSIVRVKYPNLSVDKHIEAHVVLASALVIIGQLFLLFLLRNSSPINSFLVDMLFSTCIFIIGITTGLHLTQFFIH